MTQRHISSSFAGAGKVAQRLVAGSVLALVVAFAPARLAAQDQPPLAPGAAGGAVTTTPEKESEAAGNLRTQALPPEIAELGNPTTQWLACGSAGCMICVGTRCYWRPW